MVSENISHIKHRRSAMNCKFIITLTSKTIKPIKIISENRIVSMKSHIRKNIVQQIFQSSKVPLKEADNTPIVTIANKRRVVNSLYYVDKLIRNEIYIPDTSVKLKHNAYYHLGWKQIYNKFVYLDIEQKYKELHLFKYDNTPPVFYPLDTLISLLKSDDIELTMTAFAFTLYSATKSLYKIPKNSSINDIKLSILVDNKRNIKNTLVLIKEIVKTVVSCDMCFDYKTGNIKGHQIKDYNLSKTEQNYTKIRCDKDYTDYKKLNKALAKIKRITYDVNYGDYPIIICNNKNYKHPPNKHLNSLNASPIYIDIIENSFNYLSIFIPIYSNTNIDSNKHAPRTRFLEFLENKLSKIADKKFKSKQVAERLRNKITSIINNNIDNLFLELGKTEITTITNSLFGIYFHKNQKISYFNNLYQIASKQLSFPNSDPERVRIYSYLLASLISFKEYVDELPPISPYYDPDDESYQPHNFKNNTKHSYGLESDYHNLFIDNNDDNDYEEYTPSSDPPIIDITPYKQEFYNLFDQTVEIFKKRCAADNNADINISYDDKLIQLFDCFITELINEDSNIIIKPAKAKQGLIFLDFHSYFEHFELFLEKQNFNYSISKQKFNRLLYDNKILKPRYNGSDKTPPKLDYILQANEQKYTVLAIKLDILKAKISELSK